MTGLGRVRTLIAILSVPLALSLSCPGEAARGLNYESLRAQGMALRDEIRRVPCLKTQAELDALGEREEIWQDHVTKLEESDPDIKKSGGGWRAARLAAIWNDIVSALSDLRGRPCPSSGTPLRAPHNLPISNDDDWGDSGQHARVTSQSPDPQLRRGRPDEPPYNWPGGGNHPGPGSGDHPGPGSGAYPIPGSGYPGPGGDVPGH